MPRIRNTENEYGLIAVLFHWIMALLIVGLLCIGLYMADLPRSPEKFQLYGWHKAFGILVLFLLVLRLGWRAINITPRLTNPLLEKIAARTVHWLLYFLMLGMPLSGWLMSSAASSAPSFFGLFTLPALVAPNEDLKHLFAAIHSWFAYGLIALIILHSLAALKHHYIDKDDILRRMI